MTPTTQDPKQWLKDQCNRYVNGQCKTRGCLVRGGYKPGDNKVDYDCATCEPHEVLVQIARLKSLVDAQAQLSAQRLAETERLRASLRFVEDPALAAKILGPPLIERVRDGEWRVNKEGISATFISKSAAEAALKACIENEQRREVQKGFQIYKAVDPTAPPLHFGLGLQSGTWTLEPWPEGSSEPFPGDESDKLLLAKEMSGADYARARDCVNACVGLADPSSELARLRAVEAEYAKLRKAFDVTLGKTCDCNEQILAALR